MNTTSANNSTFFMLYSIQYMLLTLFYCLQELRGLGIGFSLQLGYAASCVPSYVQENNLGTVVTDFAPLRVPRIWVQDVAENLPEHVAFYQVGRTTTTFICYIPLS